MATDCPAPRRMVCKLVPARQIPPGLAKMPLDGPARAASIARALIGDLASEHFLVFFVTAANCPIGYEIYTYGARAHVAVDPPGLIRAVIVSGADNFITVHNHPSGRALPSAADEQVWAELDTRAKAVGLGHIDDLVLGVDEYWSRFERKATPFARAGAAPAAGLGGYFGRSRKKRR